VFKHIIGSILVILMHSPSAFGGDPTTPGNLPESSQTEMIQANTGFKLTGTLITETSKHAIINGKTLKSGQYLNDETRVLNVQPGRVIIKHHDNVETLTLVPSVKKRLK